MTKILPLLKRKRELFQFKLMNSKLEKFCSPPESHHWAKTLCSEVKLELDFENGILCLLHCLVG
jgi:hypothetical protein